MSFTVLLFLVLGAMLLLVLGWALRDPGKRLLMKTGSLEEPDRSHITYFPQIQQAMARGDYAFLDSRGFKGLTKQVRKERRKIALAYLAFLRRDFQRLLRLARIIAVLSPQVGAAQEFERLRLNVAFSLRYEVIRIKLLAGLMPLPQMGSLSQAVSRLTIRLETAMKELGERAALASELASSLERSGLGTT